MNRQICKYSIIRFQPFVETGEFANIGIVLYVPTTKELHFKLLSSRENRITNFFKPLKKEIYSNIIHIIQDELKRIQNLLKESVVSKTDFYDELIRPREDIVQYSKNRVLFSTDVNATITNLFEHYVKREFAHKERYEEIMAKRIQNLLESRQLEKQFKADFIGKKGKYSVPFPFVNNNHQTAIKPIHFKQPNPNQLIDHGLTWMTKVAQLKRYGFIQPKNVLFAYNAPEQQHDTLINAFNEVKEQIEEVGIVMADINESNVITDFVQKRLSL